MLALALTLCLTTTPSAVPSARLMPETDSQLSADVQRMSLPELQFERLRLLELMPTKFGPVLVMVGVPLAAFFLGGLLPSVIPGLAIGAAQIAVIVAASVLGLAGFVVGLIWTIATAQKQAAIRRDLAEVDALIAGATPKPVAPPPVERPYEPVPGVFVPTVPTVLIARF